jgi:hypothetical protein
MDCTCGTYTLTDSSYNSVIFMTLSTQAYAVVEMETGAKLAIESGTYNDSRYYPSWDSKAPALFIVQMYQKALEAGSLQDLSLLQCIDAYSTSFQSTRGNVFLVVDVMDEGILHSSDIQAIFPTIDIAATGCSAFTGTRWVYEQSLSSGNGECFEQEGYRFLPQLRANVSSWTPITRRPVRQCMSEPAEQQCKLNFSVHLAIIVIVFNMIKALTVLAAAFQLRDDPILTIGDAAASFLATPDPHSLGSCLISQTEIHSSKLQLEELRVPIAYRIQRPELASSVKSGKWGMVWASSVFTTNLNNDN